MESMPGTPGMPGALSTAKSERAAARLASCGVGVGDVLAL